MDQLDRLFSESVPIIESALDRYVPTELQEPARLHAAIRWSLFGGGKRFRPVLAIAVANHFGVEAGSVISAAAAIEMIHTYSLIHDDLPAMDDDDLRRGRATCHKKFDEATAILAGDALQALAFRIIAEDERLLEATRLQLLAGLGGATSQMVAGQQMDLSAEGKELSVGEVEAIHRHKTGALIAFSAGAGAIAAGANGEEYETILRFGEKLGLLFQISDDLLDVTQSTEKLGKTAGKDADLQKSTYPRLLGIKATRELLADVRGQALAELNGLTERSHVLESLANFVASREQ